MSEYCYQLVRNNDYNHYLLSFFIPRKDRDDFLAILALNTELAIIPLKTNEEAAVQIRLKWWHDEVEKIYLEQPVTHSPVLIELAKCIQNHSIPKSLFYKLFLAHQNSDYYNKVFYDLLLLVSQNSEKLKRKIDFHHTLEDNVFMRALRLWIEK
jgi:phytoene/squalene synthetase